MAGKDTEHVRRWREYELTVADIFSSRFGDSVTVEHNVRLPGRITGERRQVDVLVRGPLAGRGDESLVVDCKCVGRRIGVSTVGAFMELLEDVGVDRGCLVTTKGASKGALRRIEHDGRLDLQIVTLKELVRWSPRGTVETRVAIAARHAYRAIDLLEKAGLRARCGERAGDEVQIEALRHYQDSCADGSIQAAHHDRVYRTLEAAGIPYRLVSTGVTIDGGTPAHRWVPVAETPAGPIKVLAASESELEEQVRRLEATLREPRQSASND